MRCRSEMDVSFAQTINEMTSEEEISDKIFSAIKHKNVQTVRSIAESLPPFHRKPWSSGCDLIMEAIKMKQLEIAKLLICLRILPKGSDALLPLAITSADFATVHMLHSYNEAIFPPIFKKYKPLLLSIAERYIVDESCCLILDYILRMERINTRKLRNGFSVLHLAAEFDNVIIIPLLLHKNCDINSVSCKGQTALHIAVDNENVRIVSLLLNHGARCDVIDTYKTTPLHIAAEKGTLPVIEILLDFALRNENVQFFMSRYIDLLFYCAANVGNKGIVEMTLLEGANLNKRFRVTGKTPLFVAAENGHVDVVKFLLKKSANLSQIEPIRTRDILPGETELHVAAEKGHVTIVRLLLKHGADPFATDSIGRNALHLAAKGGWPFIIHYLLKKSSTSRSLFIPSGDSGFTPFDMAVENCEEDAVRYFLKKGFSVDNITKNGMQPLHIAAQVGSNPIVLLLLEQGTQIDFVARTPVDITIVYTPNSNHPSSFEILKSSVKECKIKFNVSFTALYVAAYYGHEEVVKTLLDQGADPNVCFKHFLTPLFAAAQEGYEKIVDLLLKKGAKVNLNNTNQRLSTPLLAAAQGGYEKIVELLLQHGADVEAKLQPLYEMSRGIERIFEPNECSFYESYLIEYTALHFAVKVQNIEMVEMLLKCGANVNVETKKKKTPLILAVSKNDLRIVNKLINAGANLVSLCSKKLSPFFYAIRNSKVNNLKTLLSNGAPFETETKDGLSVLHFALYFKSNIRIFQYLLRCGAQVNVRNKEGLTILHCFLRGARDPWNCQLENNPKVVKVFKLCVENCPDLNILTKDNMEETLIHMISKADGFFDELNILLENDADLSKVDNNGKTSFFYAVERLLSHLDSADSFLHSRGMSFPPEIDPYKCRIIAKSLTRMIARLEACKQNIQARSFFCISCSVTESYYENCKQEIEKMRLVKILPRVSFFDILAANEDKLAIYAGRKEVVESIIAQHLPRLFPHYANFLRARVEKGAKRRVVIKESVEALGQVLSFTLPKHVAYDILDYLSTVELMNLCRACNPSTCKF